MKQTIQSSVVGSLKLLSAAALAALLLQPVAAHAQTLRPSSNGRFLEWSNGTPVFLLSDTCWLLPGRYSTSEVSSHVASRKAQGFTALQMTVCFPEVQNGAALQNINSIFTSGDFARPIASYFDSADAKIRQVTSAGLVAIVNPFWKKGPDAQAILERNGTTKARNYAKWLATRHRTNRHVAWFIGGDDRPEPVRAQVEAMGLGIQDAYREAGLPAPIISYHGDPGQSSREALPANPSWLTLDWTYAYSEPLGSHTPYVENWASWAKTPVKPIMHGEGWYDRDNGATTGSRWGNRHMLRRQAWWNVLSGGIAGHAYGAEPIWLHRYNSITPATAVNWNTGKDVALMKSILTSQQWWRLRPDTNNSFLSGSIGTVGNVDRAVGSTSEDGSFAMAYTPVGRTFSVRMPGSGRTFDLNWRDPASGATRFIRTATSGTNVSVSTPGNNSSGQGDWVLVATSGLPGNQDPTVAISSPANNANFASGASVTINATASDNDGTVTQVAFYRGSTLIGTDTSTPYSVTWSGAADGTYSLTAVATDDDAATRTSTAVTITVGTPIVPPLPNGTYRIINRASGKAMDVTGGRIEDNTPVIQYTYSGSTNQQWVLTDVGSSQKTLRGVKSGRYLDVIGASTADGIATQILGTTGTANNQRFTFTATDSGNYVIKAVHSGKALQPRGASLSNGAVIEQSTSTSATHQQWAPSAP